jgi:3-oxoacyl-[acyl-carrier protein] reductase
MATALVGLGSNLGDREARLQGAIAALSRHPQVDLKSVSAWFETAPVGGPVEQPAFLNGAAHLETSLAPEEVLALLGDIERVAGRRRGEPNEPRTLDLDLLFYDDLVVSKADLTLPHPRLHERIFVLQPLAQIAPRFSHPVLKQTVAELLALRLSAPLLGQRALVTGSSSGIGKAIALALSQQGADVVVHSRQSTARAEAVVEQIRRQGRRCALRPADLRNASACIELADFAWNLWGGLDLLVANAGADILTGESQRLDFQSKLDQLWQVDVRATMLLARALGERMQQAGGGCILTMGWDQAAAGMEGDSGQLFGAAKGAVAAFSMSLAQSLAPRVRVNCLAPGWIKTAWGERAGAAWQERAARESLLGRWGRPDEVAAAACWLASPAASFVNGQILCINGGARRPGAA